MKELEKAYNEKVYLVNELTSKRDQDERELEILRDEIDKERKKSLAD